MGLASMEEGSFGSWLGLATGGGAASWGGHDERRRPVHAEALFPAPRAKEEKGCGDLERRAVSEKGSGEGAKKRIRVGDDGRQSMDSPCPSDGDGGGGARKKLRLTKVQSTLLEDSFRAHNILSHVQKQQLARQVNLSSRQVEVWFQNRRARTKLKQTEVDCEFLKRCCDSLTDENRRLKQELVELQRAAAAMAGSKLFGLRLPGAEAMLNFCPSCEKVTVANSECLMSCCDLIALLDTEHTLKAKSVRVD